MRFKLFKNHNGYLAYDKKYGKLCKTACCNNFSLRFSPQHDFIRGSRSQDRKIRIEIKDFIDRARRRRGMLDMQEEFGEGDEYDLAAVIQEEERGDTLNEAPGSTLRRNLTMMQGGEPSPVGKSISYLFVNVFVKVDLHLMVRSMQTGDFFYCCITIDRFVRARSPGSWLGFYLIVVIARGEWKYCLESFIKNKGIQNH